MSKEPVGRRQMFRDLTAEEIAARDSGAPPAKVTLPITEPQSDIVESEDPNTEVIAEEPKKTGLKRKYVMKARAPKPPKPNKSF